MSPDVVRCVYDAMIDAFIDLELQEHAADHRTERWRPMRHQRPTHVRHPAQRMPFTDKRHYVK
ncbi:hypothetical protein [Mycobacterium shigaense]|uniref:hypothetical protein n=1 Tax=Mycobacterium shigaense TaxID=722731 RepID=UPI001159072A|nr:hypothetical protein [Mycobacterium shigaense]MEA1124056.1 hypothetical protein [Mycobacterium shigaense]